MGNPLKVGRPKKYTPDTLWKKAVEYFEYCRDNPLKEEKAYHYQGAINTHNISKMRAMTESGLCLMLDIDDETFRRYQKEPQFCGVIKKIKQTIKTQKFEGASADLLNANIIARDLGLKDHQEVKTIQEIDSVIKQIIEVVTEYVPEDKINDCIARIGSLVDVQ